MSSSSILRSPVLTQQEQESSFYKNHPIQIKRLFRIHNTTLDKNNNNDNNDNNDNSTRFLNIVTPLGEDKDNNKNNKNNDSNSDKRYSHLPPYRPSRPVKEYQFEMPQHHHHHHHHHHSPHHHSATSPGGRYLGEEEDDNTSGSYHAASGGPRSDRRHHQETPLRRGNKRSPGNVTILHSEQQEEVEVVQRIPSSPSSTAPRQGPLDGESNDGFVVSPPKRHRTSGNFFDTMSPGSPYPYHHTNLLYPPSSPVKRHADFAPPSPAIIQKTYSSTNNDNNSPPEYFSPPKRPSKQPYSPETPRSSIRPTHEPSSKQPPHPQQDWYNDNDNDNENSNRGDHHHHHRHHHNHPPHPEHAGSNEGHDPYYPPPPPQSQQQQPPPYGHHNQQQQQPIQRYPSYPYPPPHEGYYNYPPHAYGGGNWYPPHHHHHHHSRPPRPYLPGSPNDPHKHYEQEKDRGGPQPVSPYDREKSYHGKNMSSGSSAMQESPARQFGTPSKYMTPKKEASSPSDATAAARPTPSSTAQAAIAAGMTQPQSASEIDFDIHNPPSTPFTPPSKDPVCTGTSVVNMHDVLLGRGGGTNTQIGNRRFRALVQEFQPVYLLCRRKEKPRMARTIVLIVRNRGGRFLKKCEDTGMLYEVGDEKAEAKTSQALREGLDVRATKASQAGSLRKNNNNNPPSSKHDFSTPSRKPHHHYDTKMLEPMQESPNRREGPPKEMMHPQSYPPNHHPHHHPHHPPGPPPHHHNPHYSHYHPYPPGYPPHHHHPQQQQQQHSPQPPTTSSHYSSHESTHAQPPPPPPSSSSSQRGEHSSSSYPPQYSQQHGGSSSNTNMNLNMNTSKYEPVDYHPPYRTTSADESSTCRDSSRKRKHWSERYSHHPSDQQPPPAHAVASVEEDMNPLWMDFTPPRSSSKNTNTPHQHPPPPHHHRPAPHSEPRKPRRNYNNMMGPNDPW